MVQDAWRVLRRAKRQRGWWQLALWLIVPQRPGGHSPLYWLWHRQWNRARLFAVTTAPHEWSEDALCREGLALLDKITGQPV